MHQHISRRAVLVLLALAPVSATFADEPKGTFGFAASVEAEGIFNPTLKAVRIKSVQAGTPAALAGVLAGDSILEIDGAKVAGAEASTMSDRMKKKPGESVVLKLARPSGETYVVTLKAVASRG